MAERRGAISFFRATVLLGVCALSLGSCSAPGPSGCGMPPRTIAVAANSAFAPIMTASILQSREASLSAGTRPVPASIRSALAPYFDEATLDSVRWTVSGNRLSLDTLVVAAFPRYKAMTFKDTVVFQNASDATDLGLWIHELLHVEQVRRTGGISRFSRAYLADWAHIEAVTVRQTNAILARIDVPMRQGRRSLTKGCVSQA